MEFSVSVEFVVCLCDWQSIPSYPSEKELPLALER